MTKEEKLKQLEEMYRNGCTYAEIKDTLGFCKNTAIKYLKQSGVYVVKNPIIEITPKLLDEIQKRYNEIGNIKTVAKEFHISNTRLRKAGLVLNKPVKTKEEICAQTKYTRRIKQELIDYKGGKCEICGYDKCIDALDFHHMNPEEKDFNISTGTKSFEKCKPEVDKCILVCCRCHREIHAGLIKL